MEIILFFEFLRDVLIFALIGVSFIYVWHKKNKRSILLLILIIFLIFLISQLFKTFIHSQRPISFLINKEILGSFPSRHTALAFGVSIFLLKENFYLGILGLLISSIIAILSILSLAHFPVDVIGGIILGILIALIILKLNLFQRFDSQNKE